MSFRSPFGGYNHNMKYKGRIFHIQTEDSGENNPHIFTHLFHNGIIISTKMKKYGDLLKNKNIQDDNVDSYVRKLMQLQHKDMMKNLIKGTFDDKIVQFFGSLQPSAEDKAKQEEIKNQVEQNTPENPNQAAKNLPKNAKPSQSAAQEQNQHDSTVALDLSKNPVFSKNKKGSDGGFGQKIPTLPGRHKPSVTASSQPKGPAKVPEFMQEEPGEEIKEPEKKRPETRTEGLLSLQNQNKRNPQTEQDDDENDEDFPVTIETVSTYFFQEKQDTMVDNLDFMDQDLDYDLSENNETQPPKAKYNEAEDFFADIQTDPGETQAPSSEPEAGTPQEQSSVVVSRPAIVLSGDDSNFGSFSRQQSSSSYQSFGNETSTPDDDSDQALEEFQREGSILTETSGLFKPEESESVPDDIVSGDSGDDSQSIDDIILDFLKKQSDIDPED